MKSTLLLALFFLSGLVHGQIVDIPDANFKNALVNELVSDTDADGEPDAVVDTNGDGEIQISEAEAVLNLNLSSKDITDLTGINQFINLVDLDIQFNDITSLDISSLVNLETLFTNFNGMNSLILGSINNLRVLNLRNNNFTTWDYPPLTNLEYLNLNGSPLITLNLDGYSSLQEIELRFANLSTLSITDLPSLEIIDVFDANIDEVELSNLPSLDYLQLTELGLENIDLSGVPSVREIVLNRNNLSSIDLSVLTDVEVITLSDNLFESIDLNGLDQLIRLRLDRNQFSTINIPVLPSLHQLELWENELTELDLTNVPQLIVAGLSSNNLSSLILDESANISDLFISDNQLTSFDASPYGNLSQIGIRNNQLEWLIVKNGNITSSDIFLQFDGNPDLAYICADEEEIPLVLSIVEDDGLDAVVTSSCFFGPGGERFTVEGSNIYDLESDGCDADDPKLPFIQFSISNGSETGIVYNNGTGDFILPLNEGDYDITAQSEYPEYYTASPSPLIVSFPADPDPLFQDFCFEPLGDFNDLEVVIVPLTQAVPGFDAEYSLLLRNNGTTTLSGALEFTFEEPFMDYVSADVPPLSVADGLLTWEFTDFEPLNTLEFNVTFVLNTPTDTPPLEAGEILDFEAALSFAGTDETPDDNTFQLNQEVINSYDPNDKTALEGDKILEESVGEYMHYLIRFENLGTANAVNVVVADTIDISKYQLSTLIPIRGSHDFVTRVNDNVVEFIFEDINLPFDDANNDGFVLFKIKTQETLVLGDSFSNSAAIYFDFNAPIITNEATTTVVSTLGTNDFEADLNVWLYPNPANELLNISGLENREVKALTVYNLQGQLLIDQKDDTSAINVSGLSSGVYFVKIETAEGAVFKRFIKA